MERLTKRDTDGQAIMDCEKCKADWTGKHGKPMVDCTALYCRNRLKNRLAAYEDTGLTPEDCARAAEIDDILLDEYYPIGRMRNLIKADKEGRVIVLPAVRYCEQYGWQNITWDEKYGVCAGSWNTCEEAEKALEAMKK